MMMKQNLMKKIITTATPQRISFAGGGTDINYFYEKHGGIVLSTTIDKFIYVTVKVHNKLFKETINFIYRTVFFVFFHNIYDRKQQF